MSAALAKLSPAAIFHSGFDFSLILLILTVFTGALWLLDTLVLGPRRRARLEPGAEDKPNAFVEFCVSFFPVIFAVFLLRSFVVEPFRIPSGSMIPTLHVGDFILVNKFAYGLRCPVGGCKLIETGEPKHGDVIVFRYPAQSEDDPNRGNDFIKRVVGLPGDHIHYENKVLTVNGQTVKLEPDGIYVDDGISQRVHEDFDGVKHDIIVNEQRPPDDFDYDVPPGQYFMMGDNRDGSYDSRYWRTVPEANLKGRAFLIWMSWDSEHFRPALSRIGTVIH
jgi:signal peptidase I